MRRVGPLVALRQGLGSKVCWQNAPRHVERRLACERSLGQVPVEVEEALRIATLGQQADCATGQNYPMGIPMGASDLRNHSL